MINLNKLLLPLFTTVSLLGIPSLSADQDDYSYLQKLKYEASLAYTKYTPNSEWWTKIEPYNIYLGALPLKNEGHLDQIAESGVTHVLSMVEDFEIEDGWFNKPVKQSDWHDHGIVVKHIKAIDFLPLKREEIEEGVAFLSEILDGSNTVYVHCKAGRGRSATIVIVYLMQVEGLSFQEAHDYVKAQRPQINLNKQQRQAIFDYFDIVESSEEAKKVTLSENIYALFQNANEITEDKLSVLLDDMLFYVIEGGSSSDKVPQSLSTWIPTIEVQSTEARRNRYLREYQGDQNAATEAAIKRNHGLRRSFKLMAANAIPLVGTPTSHTISLWHQLREITLIAAIHGHDVRDPEVKGKILSCLVGGNLLKIPAITTDIIAREIVKKIITKASIGSVVASAIPAQMIFNYFTDNSARVATHAKTVFAGENSIPIAPEDYCF